MANEIINPNIKLVNAPAGSGKTYTIKSKIRDYIIENPFDKILCITFTNRAVKELLNGIDSSNVYISTIHSFLNEMISPLFAKEEIIDLYFEIYSNNINARINNPKYIESNTRYIEKYGSINLDTIKKNITTISYNETQFNTLYYGGLSHDDLISFTYKAMKRHQKIYDKISKRFKMIIIDEYQDSSPDVVKIFINAVKDTSVKLFLYGDKMQQIYKLYDNEFNQLLKNISYDKKNTNYRSIPCIVDILNKLYNNSESYQCCYCENINAKPDYLPQIIIADPKEFNNLINKIKEKDTRTLELYIYNRERFSRIKTENLFAAFNKIEKYKFGKKTCAVDVLLNNEEMDNPDILLKFLIIMYKQNKYWKDKTYGLVLKNFRTHKQLFASEKFTLVSNQEKKSIFEILNAIFILFNKLDTSIEQLISFMEKDNLLVKTFLDNIKLDDTYDEVLNVKVYEIINLEDNNSNPYVSTQHGVKGESHESVIFVAEESKRNAPYIYMYDFFRLLAKSDISLSEFEGFYYQYFNFIEQINISIKDDETYYIENSRKILDEFKSNNVFNILCKERYVDYINKPSKNNRINLKIFQTNIVERVLSAYKLFYVGCSRAKRNLTILVDKNKITEYENDFIKKMKIIGFKIIYYNDI